MWILLTALCIYVLPNVCGRSLRRDPDLFSFNTDINTNITAKIQDEAVIISLIRTAFIGEDLTKEHILFGFDIFNFVPQNFRVSVNYPNKKILFNITSTINTYSIQFDMKKKEKIKSLFLRMNDEDDTVFVVVNCDGSTSIVTPINLIKFFRTASVNKFKIMFNKRYELNVYTEDDDMEGKIKKHCNVKEVLLEGKQQIDLELDRISTKLVKYTPQLSTFLHNHKNKSEVALEIFLKAFLSKDVVHKSSNSYRLVHLIQSVAYSFLEIFQPEMQVLLSKIFWTQGKEHHYIRKWRPNYYNDVNIKNELINIMFSDSPKTFLDSMRSLSKIGQKFREVFANPRISINEVMKNDSRLKDSLLEIVFQKPLDRDQMNFLNPNHIIKKMFANYYLRDLNVNSEILNNIHKYIILRADQQDYITIGKFFRYVFFKDSGFLHANIFLESDLVIGMRVVYVLASGHVDEKRDIYWTVRSLITKKDVELPKALEYPENIISNTLRKCYQSPEMSRYIFMQTLENLFIYNNPKIGSFLDHNQGAFIYNLYRDLILNDIQKENSVLKTVLMKSSYRIQGMLGLMIQAVVANVDNFKKLRQIAAVFVNDTLSYAKIDTSDMMKSEEDYVKIFKKLIGRSSNITDEQKKVNFKIILLKYKYEKQEFHANTIEKALSQANLQLDGKMRNLLNEIYKKYGNNADTLVRKIDEILDNRYKVEKEFEDIVAQDLKEGVTFDNRPITNETTSLFLTREGGEDPSITRERIRKIQELNLIEDWYTEQAKYLPNLARKVPPLTASEERFAKINDIKYKKKNYSETGMDNVSTNDKKLKPQLKISEKNSPRGKSSKKNKIYVATNRAPSQLSKNKITMPVKETGVTRNDVTSFQGKSSPMNGKFHVVIEQRKYNNEENKPYSKKHIYKFNVGKQPNIKFHRTAYDKDNTNIIEAQYRVKSVDYNEYKKPNSESNISVERYAENKTLRRSKDAASNINLANPHDVDRRVKTTEISNKKNATEVKDKGMLRNKTISGVYFVESKLNDENETDSKFNELFSDKNRNSSAIDTKLRVKNIRTSNDAKDSKKTLEKDKKFISQINKTLSQNNTKIIINKAPLKSNDENLKFTNDIRNNNIHVESALVGGNETTTKPFKQTFDKNEDISTGSKQEVQIKTSGEKNNTFVVDSAAIGIEKKNPDMKKENVPKIEEKIDRRNSQVKSIDKGDLDTRKKNTTIKQTQQFYFNVSKIAPSAGNRISINIYKPFSKEFIDLPISNISKIKNVIKAEPRAESSDKKTFILKSNKAEIPVSNLRTIYSRGGYKENIYKETKKDSPGELNNSGTLPTENETNFKNNKTLSRENKVKIEKNKTFIKTEVEVRNVTTTSKKPEVRITEIMKASEKRQENNTNKFQDKNGKTDEVSVVNRNRSLGNEKASELKQNQKNLKNVSEVIRKNHNTGDTGVARANYLTNKERGPISITGKLFIKNTISSAKGQQKMNKTRDAKTEEQKGNVKISGTRKRLTTKVASVKKATSGKTNKQNEFKEKTKNFEINYQVAKSLEKSKKIKPNSLKYDVGRVNKAPSQLNRSLIKDDVTTEEKKSENGNAGPTTEVRI